MMMNTLDANSHELIVRNTLAWFRLVSIDATNRLVCINHKKIITKYILSTHGYRLEVDNHGSTSERCTNRTI